MSDIYIDPTKLRALPRTILPDVVAVGNVDERELLLDEPDIIFCSHFSLSCHQPQRFLHFLGSSL
jgi:hypothetical protein